MHQNNTNISGFSIIEVLVGIFIFTLGLVSVYAVVQSTIQMSDYNRNYIIATNLGKEQTELMRHIRDSNYTILKPYLQMDPLGPVNAPTSFFGTGTYKLYNDFDINGSGDFSTYVEPLSDLSDTSLYRLCLDVESRYVYCDPSDPQHIPTPLYRYIEISEVPDISDARKIRSVVEWQSKGSHDFEVNMIITDWRRL